MFEPVWAKPDFPIYEDLIIHCADRPLASMAVLFGCISPQLAKLLSHDDFPEIIIPDHSSSEILYILQVMYGGMDVYDPEDQSLLKTLGVPVKDILIKNKKLELTHTGLRTWDQNGNLKKRRFKTRTIKAAISKYSADPVCAKDRADTLLDMDSTVKIHDRGFAFPVSHEECADPDQTIHHEEDPASKLLDKDSPDRIPDNESGTTVAHEECSDPEQTDSEQTDPEQTDPVQTNPEQTDPEQTIHHKECEDAVIDVDSPDEELPVTRIEHFDEHDYQRKTKKYEKQDVYCPHCDRVIKGFSADKHFKLIHGVSVGVRGGPNQEHACKFCNYKTLKLSNLKRHVKNGSCRPGNIKCNLCDYETDSKETLQNHKRNHLYKCSYCSKYMTKYNNMTRHEESCKSKLFVCDLCHEKCTSKKALFKHAQRKH